MKLTNPVIRMERDAERPAETLTCCIVEMQKGAGIFLCSSIAELGLPMNEETRIQPYASYVEAEDEFRSRYFELQDIDIFKLNTMYKLDELSSYSIVTFDNHFIISSDQDYVKFIMESCVRQGKSLSVKKCLTYEAAQEEVGMEFQKYMGDQYLLIPFHFPTEHIVSFEEVATLL